jgi:hypothetical protein
VLAEQIGRLNPGLVLLQDRNDLPFRLIVAAYYLCELPLDSTTRLTLAVRESMFKIYLQCCIGNVTIWLSEP